MNHSDQFIKCSCVVLEFSNANVTNLVMDPRFLILFVVEWILYYKCGVVGMGLAGLVHLDFAQAVSLYVDIVDTILELASHLVSVLV